VLMAIWTGVLVLPVAYFMLRGTWLEIWILAILALLLFGRKLPRLAYWLGKRFG
jgi:hypothetical protein